MAAAVRGDDPVERTWFDIECLKDGEYVAQCVQGRSLPQNGLRIIMWALRSEPTDMMAALQLQSSSSFFT